MSKARQYSELARKNWTIWENDDRSINCEQLKLVLLMDIREELKRMNAILHCSSFLGIPYKLERIVRNTTKKRKVKK